MWKNIGCSGFAALVFAFGFAFPGLVGAAPCGAGLDSSDFTFRGVGADSCAGPFLLKPKDLSDFNDALGGPSGIGGGWSVFLTTGAGRDVSFDWNGFRFAFLPRSVIGPGAASGDFWLTIAHLSPGTAPDYPIRFDMLLAPKAGSQWAAYLFEDLEFDWDGTDTTGTWLISFNNNNSPNENPAPLSHMYFLLRDFVGSDCTVNCNPQGGGAPGQGPALLTDPPCGQDCGSSIRAVPEPGTWALMVLGLAGVARLRRRQS